MSLEAWGDEGDRARCWEESAMRQDFDKVHDLWKAWRHQYRAEAVTDEQTAEMEAVSDALDKLQEGMTGGFD